uniref:PLD phosphodiesterase domain-containing protein n=1 Tax=Knipowitschia caucasica TaxID=637954 RepID=A0AAV2JNK3_KNICA
MEELRSLKSPSEIDVPVCVFQSQQKCIVVFALVCCFAVLVALIFSAVDIWGEDEDGITEENCESSCRAVLVENIPEDVPYSDNRSSYLPLTQGLYSLLDQAVRVVEIVSPRWLLNSSDYESSFQPAARQGRALLSRLQGLKTRGIQLRISSGTIDSSELMALGRHYAEVHYLNMTALTKGHLLSSFWVIDNKHFYFGSASMDWRSLATRKELGVVVYNCSCLALDLHKVFSLYWGLQYKDFIPTFWSKRLFALFNRDQPLELTLNSTKAQAYVSTSPDVLIPKDRSSDLEAISRVILNARRFIYISIPDYLPLFGMNSKRYWSRIDGFIREALLLRKVHVRLLISCWENTNPLTFNFLWSLKSLCMEQVNCSLEAKFFRPRVLRDGNVQGINHNRFMVTDGAIYLGNLDWVGNEFSHNAGAGLVISQSGDEDDGTNRGPTLTLHTLQTNDGLNRLRGNSCDESQQDEGSNSSGHDGLKKLREPCCPTAAIMAEDDSEWVLESIVGYLGSPEWVIPVTDFMENKCTVFDGEEENKLAYTEIHQQYKKLVERLLENYMQEVGINEQQFLDACTSPFAKSKTLQIVFQPVLATDDFQIFRSLMVQKNMELQLQALRVMKERNGELPECLMHGADVMTELQQQEMKILHQVLQKSKEEYEEEMSIRMLLDEESTSSSSSEKPLRESSEVQMEASTSSQQDTVAKVSSTSGSFEDSKTDNQDRETAQRSSKHISESTNGMDPIVLPAVRAPVKTSLCLASISPTSKELEEAKLEAGISEPYSELPELEQQQLLQRASYLRQQRDRLHALKKEQQKSKHSSPAEEAPSRPALPTAPEISTEEKKRLQKRKHLAEKLKEEVIKK